jgi:hypothetical protein
VGYHGSILQRILFGIDRVTAGRACAAWTLLSVDVAFDLDQSNRKNKTAPAFPLILWNHEVAGAGNYHLDFSI